MLTTILIVVAVLVAGMLAYAATRPDTFSVRRSTTIQAPPEAILPHINDFRRWAEWSPYEKLDPDLKKTYGGAASGVGATYAWEGQKAGVGRMAILETTPTSTAIDLQFEKPFKAHHQSQFTVQPRGGATELVWSMTGPMSFGTKVMCLFVNLDRMIGKDFEAGLASLKTVTERRGTPAPAS